MSGDAVRFTAVTHRYGRQVALDAIELAVHAGCMAGLIGPNGVGKSALLGLAAGITRIQQDGSKCSAATWPTGAIAEPSVPALPSCRRARGRNLYPTLSVADELLRMTGLLPFRDRPAGKLSGGMKQKLGICASLLHDPDFLILDEPTTGIDAFSRRQFWELVDRIRL